MQRKAPWFLFPALAIFLMAGRVGAQSGAKTPELTGLAHIALRVSDLDQEVNFFGRMGFEEAFTNVEDGHTLQVFIKINDMQFVELFPQSDTPQPLGLMYACYETSDLNALHAHYAQEGLHPTPVRQSSAGNPVFTVLDSDSRVTEFTQFTPDSRQVEDRGQHLGESRVSDTLLGFEAPVTNPGAAAKFYEKLGFDVEKDGSDYRLSIPANPDLRLVLHSERVNDQPQFLFTVDDAHRAAEQLHHAGLKATRKDKLVFLRDPDGNAFVLLENSASHPDRRYLPWRR